MLTKEFPDEKIIAQIAAQKRQQEDRANQPEKLSLQSDNTANGGATETMNPAKP